MAQKKGRPTSTIAPSSYRYEYLGSQGYRKPVPSATITSLPSTPGTRPPLATSTANSVLNDPPGLSYRAQVQDLYGWKPRSLRWSGLAAFVSYILACLILFVILGYFVGPKKGYVALAGPRVDWIFLFGPQLLALVISEWVARVKLDFDLIAPYISLTRRLQGFFKQSLLPARVRDYFRDRRALLAVYCSLLLVPYQTTIFDISVKHVKQFDATFRTASPATFIDSYNGTTITPTILQAIYHGLSHINDKLRTPLWNAKVSIPGAASAIIMPILPADVNATYGGRTSAEAATWTAATAFITVDMTCSQVNNISVVVRGSSSSVHDVTATLTDNDGCIFDFTQVAFPLPVGGGSMFAAWDLLKNYGTPSEESACSQYRQYAIAGKLYRDTFSTSDVRIDTSSASRGSWGAIACDAGYSVFPDQIVSSERANDIDTLTGLQITDDLSAYSRIVLKPEEQSFDSGMASTFFDANMTNAYVDPIFGRTFYGGPAEVESYEPWYGYNHSEQWNCSACASFDADFDASAWSNEQACMLYGGVKGTYFAAFAWGASGVSQFIPSDKSATVVGSMEFTSPVWSISRDAALASVIFHGVALIWIFCIYLGHDHKTTTGLYGNPASIAAQMFYFRDESGRRIFRDLDKLPFAKSVSVLKRRFDSLTFDWGFRATGGDRKVYVRSKERQSSYFNAFDSQYLDRDSNSISDLRYSWIPWYHKIWVFSSLVILFIGLIGFDFGFMLPRLTGSGIGLLEAPDASGIQHWINTKLFSIGPTLLFVAASSLWWSNVDIFYRIAGPLAALHQPSPGKSTLCVQYRTLPDLAVTYSAARNGHWKLAYVTSVTFLGKVATIAAGSLFILRPSAISVQSTVPTTHEWRQQSFMPQTNSSIWSLIEAKSLSASLAAYPMINGWVAGFNSFIPVEVESSTASSYSNVSLNGVSTRLDCSIVENHLESHEVPQASSERKQWTLQLDSGDCASPDFSTAICPDMKNDRSGHSAFDSSRQIASIACYGWKLLPSSTCSGRSDYWLVTTATGKLGAPFAISDTAGQVMFQNTPNVTSLVCRPRFFNNTVRVQVSGPQNNILLVIDETIASVEIADDHWKSNNTSFSAYFADQMNASSLLGSAYMATKYVSMDPMSAIMAFNMSEGLDGFDKLEEIIRTASLAFSMVFSSYADPMISNQPFLFQPLGSSAPRRLNAVEVTAKETRAYPRRVPLFIVTIMLCIYAISLLIVHPWRKSKWAFPQNVTCEAGRLILIHASGAISRMAQAGDYKKPFASLANQNFALGKYFDPVDGSEHIGIDVADVVVRDFVDSKPESAWNEGTRNIRHRK